MPLVNPLHRRPRRAWPFRLGVSLPLCLGIATLVSCGEGPAPWSRQAHASAPRSPGFWTSMSPTTEADESSKEYTVKGALLFNFLKYATFPPGTFSNEKSPIKVLIVGDDPFGPILNKLLGNQKVSGRSIQIARVQTVPKEIDAQLVFTTGLDSEGRRQLIDRLKDKPCILVGETPGFAKAGGFINLYLDEDKVRFEINGARQQSTGVKLKADLLKLARIVKSDIRVGEAEGQ